MRPIVFATVFPTLLLFATGEVAAHALLDRAEPRVGNTAEAAPREVTLYFTQKLEAAFSNIMITNEAGERVDTGKTRVSGSQMAISLRPVSSGTYRVIWHVLSVDAHTIDGNYSFRVGR